MASVCVCAEDLWHSSSKHLILLWTRQPSVINQLMNILSPQKCSPLGSMIIKCEMASGLKFNIRTQCAIENECERDAMRNVIE
jgi:hypothetical protein